MRTINVTLNKENFKSGDIRFLPSETYFEVSSNNPLPTIPLLTISFENTDEMSRPFRNVDLNKKFKIDTSFIYFEFKNDKPKEDIVLHISIG